MAKFVFRPENIKESLRYYKEDGYGEINSELRSSLSLDNLEESIKNHVENIDSVMKQGDSMTLYRGFHNIDSFFRNELNSVIVDQAYSSCSKDISVSAKFTENLCCIIEFYLPREIKRYEYQDKKYENEVLLQRNLQFQILEPKKTYKGIRVHFAIVSIYTPPVISQEVLDKTRELIQDSVGIDDVIESIVEDLLEDDFTDKSDKSELGQSIMISIEQRKNIVSPEIYQKLKDNVEKISEIIQQKL